MKKLFEKLSVGGICMFVVMLVCSLIGIAGGEAMAADTAGDVTYGSSVSLAYAKAHADQIVKDAIDREVTVIKPHLCPLWTLSQNRVKAKNVTSPIWKYSEIETAGLQLKVATAYEVPDTGAEGQAAIDFGTAGNKKVSINQTLTFRGVDGYNEKTQKHGWFRGYVKDFDANGKPIIVPINGEGNTGDGGTIPAIAKDTTVLRGSRTGSETQIRTAPLASAPSQKEQYLQKFMIETKESTTFVLATTSADTKWEKSEITDFAIDEMKRTAEADLLLGVKSKIVQANKFNENVEEDTYFCEGLWYQPGKDVTFLSSSSAAPTTGDGVAFMKKIFSDSASSNVKLLLADEDFVEKLNLMNYTQVLYPGKQAQNLGLNVQRLIYGDKELVIINEPAFKDMDMKGCGLVIDEEYFERRELPNEQYDWDNAQLGQSASKSQAFIFNFALALKNPNAHARVYVDPTVYASNKPVA